MDHTNMNMESITQWLGSILTENQPFPGDDCAMSRTGEEGGSRFAIEMIQHDLVQIYDH